MYNVQCLAGHVYQAPGGSELEDRCRKRAEKGFIDALCLSDYECIECLTDRARDLRKCVDLCTTLECPAHSDVCHDGCLLLRELCEIEARGVYVSS